MQVQPTLIPPDSLPEMEQYIESNHPSIVPCAFDIKVLKLTGERQTFHTCYCYRQTLGDVAALVNNIGNSRFLLVIGGLKADLNQDVKFWIVNGELNVQAVECIAGPPRQLHQRLDQISPDSRRGPLIPLSSRSRILP